MLGMPPLITSDKESLSIRMLGRPPLITSDKESKKGTPNSVPFV